ncbi:proton-conducting transporter membrane subunit, partial [Pandoraea pneumonica]
MGASFAVGAFSVAGVPPAAGFLGKLALFRAALEAGGVFWSTVLTSLVFAGGALSFVYCFQVYQRAYMVPDDAKPDGAAQRALLAV